MYESRACHNSTACCSVERHGAVVKLAKFPLHNCRDLLGGLEQTVSCYADLLADGLLLPSDPLAILGVEIAEPFPVEDLETVAGVGADPGDGNFITF